MPAVRPAHCVFALLALLCSGCGLAGKQTGTQVGDTGGEHMVAFATDRPGLTGGYDLALYDLDAGGYRALPNINSATAESEPSLSEDGALIVFASDRSGGAGGTDLYVYGRAAMGTLDVPNLNTAADESYPRFAYDNRYLAFVRDSLTWTRIRLYDPVGDSLVNLDNISSVGAWKDSEPSPDLHADRIAFSSDRAGAKHLYVWNRGTGVAVIPDLVGDLADAEPSLSSDGRWLAFASNRSGAAGWDIYLYDLQTLAFVRLPRLNTAGEERHPSVNAAGTRIMFQARATGSDDWDLWSWTMSDSTARQPGGLSNADANDAQPSLRWR